LPWASATTASYSAFVSAEAVDGKNRQEKANSIANKNLWGLLICNLLVGSAQQVHYTIKLY
jgi:hypothetical protein